MYHCIHLLACNTQETHDGFSLSNGTGVKFLVWSSGNTAGFHVEEGMSCVQYLYVCIESKDKIMLYRAWIYSPIA